MCVKKRKGDREREKKKTFPKIHKIGEKISNEYFFRSVLVVGCILVGIDPGWLMAGQHLLVSLPQSRLHEREADRIGILLANKAGFDPNVTLSLFFSFFWKLIFSSLIQWSSFSMFNFLGGS